jgi:hypothetical protein
MSFCPCKPLLTRSSVRRFLALGALPALLVLAGSSLAFAENKPESLLSGKQAMASEGVKQPQRLTDGMYSNEGDEWLTDVTSRFMSSRAFAEWDLGGEQPIRCALVQADNNDVYIMSTSTDGVSWQPLWRIGTENGAGMRLRNQKVETRARYVRLSATGGDALYSVAEVAVYAECPKIWPPELVRTRGIAVADTVNTKVVIFGIFAVFFLLVHRRRAGRSHYFLVLPAAAAGLMLARELGPLYPFFDQEPALRALLAGLAALLAIKEAYLKEDAAPTRKVALATLGFCAAMAFATYAHFGAPQFFDEGKGRRTFVHTADMRQNFPTAKYFRELGYDGAYLASLAAYAEDNPEFAQRMADVRVRDLRDGQIRLARDLGSDLAQVRSRFSPERWQSFRNDMRYFANAMGEAEYLAAMQDHGTEATPAWLLPASLVLGHVPASEGILTFTGLLDPLLLLLLFYVVGRTFDWRVMMYLVVLWGVSDFPNWGTNMMGSTLRLDWVLALGFGLCALKAQRSVLGGVLLAYAALSRVYPTHAAAFLAVPILWFVIDYWRQHKRVPRFTDLRDSQRPALRALAGAAGGALGILLLSSLFFGVGSWGAWREHAQTFVDVPYANSMGVRTLVAFDSSTSAAALAQKQTPNLWGEWERLQNITFNARYPLFVLALLAATALALVACRKRNLMQVSLIGLLLVPFYSYAANPLYQFVFLLPLLMVGTVAPGERDRPFALAVVALLALAVGQSLSQAEIWNDLRYADQTFLLVAAVVLILLTVFRQTWRAAPLWVKEAKEEEKDEAAEDEEKDENGKDGKTT